MLLFINLLQLHLIKSNGEKLPAKYWYGNLLQLYFIKNYFLRKTACKILLWKKLPGNFVPMFPCLCTPDGKLLLYHYTKKKTVENVTDRPTAHTKTVHFFVGRFSKWHCVNTRRVFFMLLDETDRFLGCRNFSLTSKSCNEFFTVKFLPFSNCSSTI